MKTRIFLAQLVLLTLCGAVALADDTAEGKKNLFKEYVEKFGSAGPEHKFLEPLVGHFTAKVRMWADPEQPPKVVEGEAVRKTIFEGRFLVEEFMCDMKNAERPFRGIGFIGFDRGHKKWETVWLDSMDTAMKDSKGTYDESTKTWTFKNEGTCPITGKPLKTREVLHIVNNNEQQFDMYRQLGDEKEFKALEVIFTRQNKASGQ